ncbi:MAG TPA: DUF3800 domain-containing protein [Pelolinea sp.]|nr:DUF3800 domain-containing protein [Pelolinea sp.]
MNNTFIAFTDESCHNIGRYRGVGMVSLHFSNYHFIKIELKKILQESRVREFKFEKLRNAKYRFAAEKIIDFIFNCLLSNILRVDVLIWDTHDSRHSILGRDDINNLQRMYFHLFKNVLSKRWPSGSDWFIFPDENSAINWVDINAFLVKKDTLLFLQYQLDQVFLRSTKIYKLKEVIPVTSMKHSLIQVSDLFVGLTVYSYNYFEEYRIYKVQDSKQLLLFEAVERSFSNKEKECFGIMDYLDKKCKHHKLGVSLNKSNGFYTFSPSTPLNFWLYKPQGGYDSAPVR